MKISGAITVRFILFFLIMTCGCKYASLGKIVSLYKDSSGHYEELVKANPGNLSLRLKLAGFYYQLKNYSKTESLLKEVNDLRAKILLAKTYARMQNFSFAIELFEQIGEIHKDSEYMYLYAWTLEEKQLFPRAVEMYGKLTASPYYGLGKERVEKIGVKIEKGVPDKITQALEKHNEFFSRVEEEDAAILFVDESVEVKNDNTMVSTIHFTEKILKEKGKEDAEVQIGYDSTYERVELEYARTITPDGRMVYAGRENIRDVSKYLNFPLYSNAKVVIISMPSVELGSVIEYKVKVYSSNLVNGDDFGFTYGLRSYYPIGEQTFRITTPKTKEANIHFINQEYAQGINLSPVITEEGDNKVYYWKFEEIDPIIPEAEMPPLSKVNTAIDISSFDSWQEVYAWWLGLVEDKTNLTVKTRSFVSMLIKDCKSDLDKAKKIYEFCIKEIRYVAVEYGESGYEPHTAEEVFLNRYGDCKDKATLLVAMLRCAGLKAYPVLIPTRETYPIDKDFPSINFNHAIAAVELDGQIIFMDATASTTSFSDLPFSDQNRNVFVFFKDGYKVLTTPVLQNNETLYEMDINIDSDENALISRKITTAGNYAAYQRYYLKYTHPQRIKENLQQKMKDISPLSEFINYEIRNVDDFDKQPVLQYSFKARKFLNPAKNLRVVSVADDINIDAGYAGKEKRIFPIELGGISKQKSRISIKLPPELKVKYLPQNTNFATKWFEFISTYDCRENSLDLYKEFSVKEQYVESQEYGEFKKSIEEVFYFLNENVILEKDEEKKDF